VRPAERAKHSGDRGKTLQNLRMPLHFRDKQTRERDTCEAGCANDPERPCWQGTVSGHVRALGRISGTSPLP